MAAKGPVFVHLSIKPEIENTPVQFRQRAPRTMQVAIREMPTILAND